MSANKCVSSSQACRSSKTDSCMSAYNLYIHDCSSASVDGSDCDSNADRFCTRCHSPQTMGIGHITLCPTHLGLEGQHCTTLALQLLAPVSGTQVKLIQSLSGNTRSQTAAALLSAHCCINSSAINSRAHPVQCIQARSDTVYQSALLSAHCFMRNKQQNPPSTVHTDPI